MDSFLKQRFNAAKCKTCLKLTVPRIKLLRNRREVQLKQMRRDIAKLLAAGQEATARIRVEHIIREEKMMAAQEIVELFSELIAVRLPIIEAQRECPLDLKEAISTLCFAAPRCADLPELLQIQMLFATKYGKEFVAAATELLPECGVNRQVVELLSIRAPAPEVKLKLLKDIAEEHELDWDPSASEGELLKSHEDLLNGPTQFASGSKLPFPSEKLEHKTSPSEPATQEHTYSEEDSDIIDFPEVPTQPLGSNRGAAVAPYTPFFPASAASDGNNQEPNLSTGDEILSSSKVTEDKQFLPFMSPPSHSLSFPPKEQNSTPSIPTPKNEKVDVQEVLAAARAAAESAERAAASAWSCDINDQEQPNPPTSDEILSSPNISESHKLLPSISPSQPSDVKEPKARNGKVDLQEVIAAAHAAAETAERAAAAARSAANIAQLRISELVNRSNDGVSSKD